MNWQQRNRHAEKGCQENHPYFGRVARHGEADELADVVEDATAFTHGGDDGRKIVILVAMVAERTATDKAPPRTQGRGTAMKSERPWQQSGRAMQPTCGQRCRKHPGKARSPSALISTSDGGCPWKSFSWNDLSQTNKQSSKKIDIDQSCAGPLRSPSLMRHAAPTTTRGTRMRTVRKNYRIDFRVTWMTTKSLATKHE
jgi:hypothetical protein